jgi:small-conductance mechanosensitive channel
MLVLVSMLGGYLLSRLTEFFLARRLANSKIQPDVIHIIKRVSFYLILVLVALTILSVLGIPITAFAFATGAIAIGVGFGAQNIINNFISGWILIAERPIRINDFIEIDGNMGTVSEVGARSTLIHRTDGVHMLVPNSTLLETTVINWTLLDRNIRTSLRIGVAYGSNPMQVVELMKEAVSGVAEVLDTPPPEYVFEDFGDSALIFDVYFWSHVMGAKTLRSIRSDIRFRISEIFAANDVVIAFPQMDIHLHTQEKN